MTMTRDEAEKLLDDFLLNYCAERELYRQKIFDALTTDNTKKEEASLLDLLFIAEDYLKDHWDMNSVPLNKITSRLNEERKKGGKIEALKKDILDLYEMNPDFMDCAVDEMLAKHFGG